MQILDHLEDFWGTDGAARTRGIHNPLFIEEFTDTTFVLHEDGRVVAYLFGFWSQAEPAGYIHLVAVRNTHQRRGIGESLYRHFESLARERGCTALKATTSPVNAASIAFHRRMGFELLGHPNADGVPVVADHAGRGVDKVVYRKQLT